VTLWTTATSTDERHRAARVAVLPIGSFEQHGTYLPLITDTVVACAIARAITDRYDLMLLPPVTVSCSHEHSAWPGTVSISAATLAAVVHDTAASLRRAGVERLVLVNGHGGNYVLSNVVQEATVDGPRLALYPTSPDWLRARDRAGLASSAHDDMHAGEIETSILLQIAPELVRDGNETADHHAERPHLLIHGMTAYTHSGVIGTPSLGTAGKGQAVLDSLTDDFAETLAALGFPTTA
jgi:creatinine amidohydrolase